MGFPMGYSELPKLLHFLFLLVHLRRLVSWALASLGLGHLVDGSDDLSPEAHGPAASAAQELQLPVLQFGDLARAAAGRHRLPEACAVCLSEFAARDEVRRPGNCRHVFHRWCLDRWAAHGPRTCPLCRAPLAPDERQEEVGSRVAGSPGSDECFICPSSPSPPPASLLPLQLAPLRLEAAGGSE